MMLTLILGIVLLLLFLYIMYKHTNTILERVIYWLVFIIVLSPVIIYYFDLYNLPTKMGWVKDADAGRWFGFVSTYVSTIVGTLVSSFVVVLTVLKQIQVQNENLKDDKRIENAPLLKYYIKNESIDEANQSFIFNSEGKIYNIYFGIENIGLNHAKHIKIKLLNEEENWNRTFQIEDEQSILKKGDTYWFDFIINFMKDSSEKKKISILVSYFDMLNNEYEQQIDIKHTVTDALEKKCKGLMTFFGEIDIKDEHLKK